VGWHNILPSHRPYVIETGKEANTPKTVIKIISITQLLLPIYNKALVRGGKAGAQGSAIHRHHHNFARQKKAVRERRSVKFSPVRR
jgi:hypothetical protein